MDTQISLEIAIPIVKEIFTATAKGIGTWFKTQDILGLAATIYAENMLAAYSSIKVLGMTQPVPLEQLYVTLNVLEKITARRGIDAKTLQQWFDSDRKGFGTVKEKAITVGSMINKYEKIIALGKPGAGKTTLLKYIAHQSFAPDYIFSKRRLPVFISLKPFAEDAAAPTLLQAIVKEFALCGIADCEGFVIKMLEEGSIRLLLDGLDEVNEANLDRTLQAVKEFERQYRKNQIIVTCRTAAYNHYLELFTDVEVADFKDEQKERFIHNYFAAEAQTAKDCWAILEGNASLRELACSPLLLTLLCIVFSENNHFPANRAGIYADAADVLLRKWDASRRIKDRPTLYKNLSLQRKKDLLSQIAYQTFMRGQYFVEASVFERHIAHYIKNLPDAEADKIHADAAEILREIDAHHSLLTERAHGVYSFSHLTLQEYFTANYLTQHPNLLPQIASLYTTEPRWQEVFLLSVNLLPDAAPFIQAIQAHIAGLVQQNPHIARLLEAVEGALLPDRGGKYPVYERRIMGIVLARALDRARARDLDLARDLALARDLDLDRLLSFTQNILGQWTKEEMDSFTNYLSANTRLVACLKAENYLSKAKREEVYAALFTPPAAPTAKQVPAGAAVYFLYAEADREWVEKLDTHLAALKRSGVLQSTWYKARILPGGDMNKEATEYLQQAKVVLLMISANFIASDSIWHQELKAALARQEAGEARIIPVMVRECELKGTLLGELKALPAGAALVSHPQPDEALRQITIVVQEALLLMGG